VRFATLADVAELNPRQVTGLSLSEPVAFVPMASVSAETASTESVTVRPYGEVSKGYTPMCNGDVLVAKITPCFENGKIAHAQLPTSVGFGSTEFHVIRARGDAADSRYLLHFLRQGSIRVEGERRMTGSGGQRRVPAGYLAELKVPLPPLPEQRRIAEVLDRAETLRAKRRQALAQLDALAESIFLDMFGDPVSNPMGWPDRSLGGTLRSQQYGPRFYNEQYTEGGTRIVRITDLSEGGSLDFASMPRLAVDAADREKYRLNPGDVIFARTGATVGKVALIRPGDPECIAGAYFISMRFDDAIRPEYAHAVLRAKSIRLIVEKRSRQAAQQNFSGPSLRQLPMPVPPVELQREFVSRLGTIERVRSEHVAAQSALDTLFASLQHRAFRGEL
jgi:type I restriction enzyme, S subunit